MSAIIKKLPQGCGSSNTIMVKNTNLADQLNPFRNQFVTKRIYLVLFNDGWNLDGWNKYAHANEQQVLLLELI